MTAHDSHALDPAHAPASTTRLSRVVRWWPVLLPPLTIVVIYATRAMGWTAWMRRSPQEKLALVLMPIAVLIYAVRWARTRDRLYLVLGALSLAFTCREIHFVGTHRGIYIALALIGFWCIMWRRSLWKVANGTTTGRWLAMAAWAYLFALLIQRRAFRFLPAESSLHVQMEEVAENVAHLLLILVGLV